MQHHQCASKHVNTVQLDFKAGEGSNGSAHALLIEEVCLPGGSRSQSIE
jgi:hypothetical protein